MAFSFIGIRDRSAGVHLVYGSDLQGIGGEFLLYFYFGDGCVLARYLGICGGFSTYYPDILWDRRVGAYLGIVLLIVRYCSANQDGSSPLRRDYFATANQHIITGLAWAY